VNSDFVLFLLISVGTLFDPTRPTQTSQAPCVCWLPSLFSLSLTLQSACSLNGLALCLFLSIFSSLLSSSSSFFLLLL
jgi:hypothetical protein